VNATYIAQSFDHLAACAARIEVALLERISAKRKRVRRSTRA